MKNRIKFIALILGLLIALAFPLSGAGAVVDPDGAYCMDKAGVISTETVQYISDRNHNLEKNCKGAQICVVVLDSIGSQRIEDYTAMVFEKWKIGQSGENNGVLLLMTVEEKDYYILSGSGLSSVLTTKTLSNISRNAIEPNFKEGKYDAAVSAAFKMLNETVCNHYKVDPFASADGTDFLGGGSGIFDLGSGLSFLNDFSTGPVFDCVSCVFSCGACGSCGGFGGILMVIFVIYVISQVIKYKASSRVNRSGGAGSTRANPINMGSSSNRANYTTHRPPFGGAKPWDKRNGVNYASSGNWHAGSNPGPKQGGSGRTKQ